METNSKGKRMVFEEDIKYLQELKGENISSKTVGRVVDTEDITTLSDEVCNALKCGDMINKVDSTGKHSYRVSYKKDEVGMCLTYSDASCVETISYDYTAGHWVYNSKDVTTIENMNKFEKIKDKSGHLRFIEGDYTPESIAGITFSYSKWSLSGSHLMIVLAGTGQASTAITSGTIADITNIPQWILNKVYDVSSSVIESKSMIFRKTAGGQFWVTQSLNVSFRKAASSLYIRSEESLTLSNDSAFRIQFDLLIDNE